MFATGVNLDLNGCELVVPLGPGADVAIPTGPWTDVRSLWPRQRATLHLGGGARLFSSRPGARVWGGNRTPSYLGDWAIGCAYDSRYEAQHAVRVSGDRCVLDLTNVELAWTYGDGVYVEWWVDHTEMFGVWDVAAARDSLGGYVREGKWRPAKEAHPGIHHTGRQGFAQSGGTDLYVHDLPVWQIGRSYMDFEPGAGGTVSGIRLERLLAGIFANTWLAAKGNGYVHNLRAEGCRSLHKAINVYCVEWQGSGHRRNWALVNNSADRKAFYGSPLDCMRFERVDGLEVRGNLQYVDKRQAGRGLYTDACTNVVAPDLDKQFPLV